MSQRSYRRHLQLLLSHFEHSESSSRDAVLVRGDAAAATTTTTTTSYFKVRPDSSVDRTSFWKGSWKKDRDAEPGFHLTRPNPTLESAIADGFLDWPDHSQRRLLVPLCGKTLDLRYLAEQGLPVVGVEGIDDAIAELAAESKLALEPVNTSSTGGKYAVQRAAVRAAGGGTDGEVTVCVGDWFEFEPVFTGNSQLFTHAFDRAALVAVPPHARAAYAAVHARVMAKGGKVCLSTVTKASNDGPPFSVTPDQVHELFSNDFEIVAKGANPHPVRKDAVERVYILTRK